MPTPILEAFDDAAGPPVDICAGCLGPRRDAVEHIVVLADEPVPSCARCAGPVDAVGRSALLLTATGVMPPVVAQLEEAWPSGKMSA